MALRAQEGEVEMQGLRTAEHRKGLLQDHGGNGYKWTLESQKGLNAILHDQKILTQIDAGSWPGANRTPRMVSSCSKRKR